MEPKLIPVEYACGHSINLLSPGVSDPEGQLQNQPLPVKLTHKCWECNPDSAYLKPVPPETTELLRKKKKGEA